MKCRKTSRATGNNVKGGKSVMMECGLKDCRSLARLQRDCPPPLGPPGSHLSHCLVRIIWSPVCPDQLNSGYKQVWAQNWFSLKLSSLARPSHLSLGDELWKNIENVINFYNILKHSQCFEKPFEKIAANWICISEVAMKYFLINK